MSHKNYRPKAVLLSTMRDELFVEFLLGFSVKNPEYVLCVCQKLAKALMERPEESRPDHIHLYSCSEHVITLIRRLLDKQYSFHREMAVLKGEKPLNHAEDPPAWDIDQGSDALLWHREADAVFAQRNISEKSLWMALKNKGTSSARSFLFF